MSQGESARHKAVLAAVLAVQRGFVSPEEAVKVLAELGPGNGSAEKSPMQTLLSVAPTSAAKAISDEVEAMAGKPVAETLAKLGVDAQGQSSLLALKPSASEAATKALSSLADRRQKLKDMTSRLTGTGGTGRYIIRREFARGGMGAIYVALDNAVGREVALKELLPGASGTSSSPGSTDSPELVERFLREAKVTGQLEHPNIVPVYEIAARDDGTVFYTMKLVRGKTMAHKLQQIQGGAGTPQQKLDARLKLLDAFSDVCNAIAYAHSRGVIHRDLKPANIMLGDFGETLVLDWGLARVQGQEDSSSVKRKVDQQAFSPSLLADDSQNRTLDGSVLGTPAYMPPEQARGELDKLDERADVYALGAMLYELLSGRPPYEGANARDVLAKVLVLAPEPVEKLAPFAPPDLVSLANKAMARDPAQRMRTAEALGAEVLAYRDGRELSVYRYSSAELLGRFVRRHRAAVAVATVALLVVLCGGAYAFVQVSDQRDEAQRNLAEAESQRNARLDAEQRAERQRARLVEERRQEIDVQRSRMLALRGANLRGEARARIAEIKTRGVTAGLSPADRTENARIVSGLLSSAAAAAELLRLLTSAVAGKSEEFVSGTELSDEVSALQDTRLLAAELAMLNEDFALSEFIIEGTQASVTVLDDWRSRVAVARDAVLARHRTTIEDALSDVREGLARGSRPRGSIRLEDYVIQLSAYREPQTVELLAKALQPRIRQAAEPIEFWSQAERDEITLICRVLGYLELPALTAPVLANLMDWLDDSRLAIECGVALCQTASEHAWQPLLNARKRFGPQNYVWRRILRWFDRVPEPKNLPEPNTAAGYVELSRVRNSRGNPVAAQADIEKALKLEPDNVDALTDKASYSGIEVGLALCERVLGLKPDHAPAYSVMANWYYQGGNFADAIRCAQKAIDLDPTQARYYMNLGFYNWRAGNNDAALEAYNKSEAIDDDLPLTFTNRAAIYIQQDRFAEAIEDLSKALDLDPLLNEAWINRAITRHAMGNLDGALDDANRALELAPNHPWAVNARADIYRELKRYAEALVDFDKVLPSNEHWFAASYAKRGDVKAALEDKTGAIADYKRYLDLCPEGKDRAEVQRKLAELEGG